MTDVGNPVLVALIAALLPAAVAAGQCEIASITASVPAAGDQFGDAVAVSGDLAVVGASRHDFLGSASGAAYIYRYQQDPDDGPWRWVEQTRLVAPDGAVNDLFGWSVGVDAHVPEGAVVVVGAYGDDHEGGTNAGSAYVFQELEDRWVFMERLVAPDAAGGDEFGRAVAVDGDVIVVGAARDDEGGTNTGSTFVFRNDGAGWSGTSVKLLALVTADHDNFGLAVTVAGNGLLVGAPLHDHDGLLSSGAVFPFRYDGATWLAEPKIVPDDLASGDRFGEAIAMSGDLATIGSFLDDDGGQNSGAVYVLRYDAGWFSPLKLTASDGGADRHFGRAVGVFDGPGDDDVVVVGAPFVPPAGAAYTYLFDGVDWTETSVLTPSGDGTGDDFGLAVAADEAYLLVGASKSDGEGGANDGAAYVYTSGVGVIVDCNANGVSDFCDILDGSSEDCNANGVPDDCDLRENPELDSNGNGVLDACEDCNGNGTIDEDDIANGTSADCNANGIPDECEVPEANGGLCTEDCDPDCNANGIPDSCDIADGTAEDCNENGIPDSCDIADGTSNDVNGDGVPDECSDDCNDNGIPDFQDIADGTSQDCNENEIPDECDIADGTSQDLDDNGVPDECQDCDGNGIPDFIDLQFGEGVDCNDNDILDVCEILEENGGTCTEDCDPDCNANGIPDECDIAEGTESDCDANGVPDVCDPDCNGNGRPDACDIADGTSEDVNDDGIPDECQDCNGNGTLDDEDIANGTSEDCNMNGIPDECDIADGTEEDCTDNGRPDSCDIDDGEEDDFNGNGIPDRCEPDCDGDGLPDFLELLIGVAWDCNENGIPDQCDIADGTATDADGNGLIDACCLEDLNDDGLIAVADLLAVISAWGPCPFCDEDLRRDRLVDVGDLITLLTVWGECERK